MMIQVRLSLLLVLAGLTCVPQMKAAACDTLPAASARGYQPLLQAFLDANCYTGWQHDPQIRSTNGVHPRVKVYYSPSMWNWMTTNKRQGDVPDGAILIKEQYGIPETPTKLSDWAIMVRDSKAAWDGWYWADLVPTSSVVPSVIQPPPPCEEAIYPSAGFGQYCINCHGSAAQGQNTYATDAFVNPPLRQLKLSGKQPEIAPEDNLHMRLARMRPLGTQGQQSPSCMVAESYDHVVAGNKLVGPTHFVTSDQCTGCHNATPTINPARQDSPSMLLYKKKTSALAGVETVNLSPNGEWRNSMMGLAGRDPIFFSQLNSETTLHGNLKTQAQPKAFVQDLCLHCHAAMGQRQFHEDAGGQPFIRDMLNDKDTEYGALGREGISCAICHRMSAEGLGTPATYTGNFNLEDPTKILGPFADVKTLPMENALGMKPQKADQITTSAMCGSCHTIILPVFRANGDAVMDTNTGKQKTFTEQATFFEWQNSNFRDNGSTPKSCQDCHMPNSYMKNGDNAALSYKIANIEDSTFPDVANRAPDQDITINARSDYRRHLLLGINVFALEMFKQFRNELGLYEEDPMMRPSLRTDKGIDTAIDMSANVISKTRTANVDILTINDSNQNMQIDVQVTNKAGHNFPSGVGFRRAFLNLQLLDRDGQVIWASGNVAPVSAGQALQGLIVDGAGKPLTTEVFTPTQQTFQQHYWQENPITRQDQVQIYEELVRNPEGQLSTSFIALNEKVKDNRLQPQGWSTTGLEAQETAPVGTCIGQGKTQECDPSYINGTGSSTVRYQVPLSDLTAKVASVKATLYYQTIPPYYQWQRANDATGVDTDRLIRFRTQLAVNQTAISNWALPITTVSASVQH